MSPISFLKSYFEAFFFHFTAQNYVGRNQHRPTLVYPKVNKWAERSGTYPPDKLAILDYLMFPYIHCDRICQISSVQMPLLKQHQKQVSAEQVCGHQSVDVAIQATRQHHDRLAVGLLSSWKRPKMIWGEGHSNRTFWLSERVVVQLVSSS